MIKIRQHEELLVTLNYPLAQAADANVASFLVPFACRLKAIYAKLTVAGTTLTSVYDVNKNGTTIYSGSKLEFATTAVDPVAYNALSADPTEFVKGDVLSLDCDTAHTTPAEGLVVQLVLQRGKASRAAATATGGIGPENE